MKRGIMLVLAMLCVAGTNAQKVKIVDRSAKKVPTWVGGAQSDYIITQAFAADLETAKAMCLEDVRKQSIRAVAENVASSSEGNISQTVENGSMTEFVDTFTSTYQTQSADVPFLKGISATKIEAYYWEKQQTGGQVKYLYAIKYPFPSVELKQLVREFEKRDAEMYVRYKALEEGLDDVHSLEEIDRAIVDIGPLVSYFFDKTRKRAAETLRENYRKLYNNVAFRSTADVLGEHRFVLTLDGRVITTSQRLTAKSEGATELTVENVGDEIVVKYNHAGAEWDVENVVTTNVKIGGKTVPYKFSFYVKKLMR